MNFYSRPLLNYRGNYPDNLLPNFAEEFNQQPSSWNWNTFAGPNLQGCPSGPMSLSGRNPAMNNWPRDMTKETLKCPGTPSNFQDQRKMISGGKPVVMQEICGFKLLVEPENLSVNAKKEVKEPPKMSNSGTEKNFGASEGVLEALSLAGSPKTGEKDLLIPDKDIPSNGSWKLTVEKPMTSPEEKPKEGKLPEQFHQEQSQALSISGRPKRLAAVEARYKLFVVACEEEDNPDDLPPLLSPGDESSYSSLTLSRKKTKRRKTAPGGKSSGEKNHKQNVPPPLINGKSPTNDDNFGWKGSIPENLRDGSEKVTEKIPVKLRRLVVTVERCRIPDSNPRSDNPDSAISLPGNENLTNLGEPEPMLKETSNEEEPLPGSSGGSQKMLEGVSSNEKEQVMAYSVESPAQDEVLSVAKGPSDAPGETLTFHGVVQEQEERFQTDVAPVIDDWLMAFNFFADLSPQPSGVIQESNSRVGSTQSVSTIARAYTQERGNNCDPTP